MTHDSGVAVQVVTKTGAQSGPIFTDRIKDGVMLQVGATCGFYNGPGGIFRLVDVVVDEVAAIEGDFLAIVERTDIGQEKTRDVGAPDSGRRVYPFLSVIDVLAVGEAIGIVTFRIFGGDFCDFEFVPGGGGEVARAELGSE